MMNTQPRNGVPAQSVAQTDNAVLGSSTIEPTVTSVNEAAVRLTEKDLDPFIKVITPSRPSLTYERVE
jgi:hypothetical protein